MPQSHDARPLQCGDDSWVVAQRAVHSAHRPLSPSVAVALVEQNRRFAPSAARDAHLAALRRGAAAVVTGQQVGLFLGPVFNLYKAVSAIRTARALSASTGKSVVPIFWLQTEDHDLVEVASHHTLAAGGVPLSLELDADASDRRSLAHQTLPADVEKRLADLRAALAGLPHGDEHVDRLAEHYVAGRGWSAAFAGLLAELFADEGLVLIDARSDAFAAEHVALHTTALTEAHGIAAALAERVRERRRMGAPAPVHVRSAAPLSFFHPEGRDGPRHRLVPDGAAWRAVGRDGRWTTAELLARLHDDPLSFSTSALLRPILQDTLLPTAVYVGGATEVAYFAQLPSLYAAYGRAMPFVVERASFRIIGDRCARLLDRWGLRAEDCEAPMAAVLHHVAPSQFDAATVSSALLDPFLAGLAALEPQLLEIDDDLKVAVEKTRDAVAASVARLGARYERAYFRRNTQLVADVTALLAILHPAGHPQERFYGLSGFAARYGARAFLEQLVDATEPFVAARHNLRCHRDRAPGSEVDHA